MIRMERQAGDPGVWWERYQTLYGRALSQYTLGLYIFSDFLQLMPRQIPLQERQGLFPQTRQQLPPCTLSSLLSSFSNAVLLGLFNPRSSQRHCTCILPMLFVCLCMHDQLSLKTSFPLGTHLHTFHLRMLLLAISLWARSQHLPYFPFRGTGRTSTCFPA